MSWCSCVIFDVFRCIGAPIAAEVDVLIPAKMAEQLEENFEDRPVGRSLSKEVRPRKSCSPCPDPTKTPLSESDSEHWPVGGRSERVSRAASRSTYNLQKEET